MSQGEAYGGTVRNDLVIRAGGAWVLDGDRLRVVENASIGVLDGRITEVGEGAALSGTRELDASGMLVLPGLINGHTHAHIGAIGRGGDDWDPAEHHGRLRFDVSGRTNALAERILDDATFELVTELGVIEHALGGATMLIEQVLAEPEPFLRVIERLGLRADVCPIVPTYDQLLDVREVEGTHAHERHRTVELEQVAATERLHSTWHAAGDGRIGIRFGLHAPDTAAPDALDAVADGMRRLGVGLHVHLDQSPLEVENVRKRTGLTPAAYLDHHGVLGPSTIAAHLTAAPDDDLALVVKRGATIASCPVVYAMGGYPASWGRFRAAGANVILGSDNYMHDLIEVMKIGALYGKTSVGSAAGVRAVDAIEAVTRNAATALGREDLGAIAPGMRADLTIVDLERLMVAPSRDPLRSAVYYANASNVAWTLVDGQVVVERGTVARSDQERVLAVGSDAIRRVWWEAELRGWV